MFVLSTDKQMLSSISASSLQAEHHRRTATVEATVKCVTIMCRNDELSPMMSWVGCLLKDLELLVLFAKNSQILLKISVIPILLTFIYLVALYLLVNNQLNSSLWHIIVKLVYSQNTKVFFDNADFFPKSI